MIDPDPNTATNLIVGPTSATHEFIKGEVFWQASESSEGRLRQGLDGFGGGRGSLGSGYRTQGQRKNCAKERRSFHGDGDVDVGWCDLTPQAQRRRGGAAEKRATRTAVRRGDWLALHPRPARGNGKRKGRFTGLLSRWDRFHKPLCVNGLKFQFLTRHSHVRAIVRRPSNLGDDACPLPLILGGRDKLLLSECFHSPQSVCGGVVRGRVQRGARLRFCQVTHQEKHACQRQSQYDQHDKEHVWAEKVSKIGDHL